MLAAVRARVARPAVRQLRSSSLLLSSARPLSLLPSRFATFTVVVPPIADSISEGTLAEQCVAVGGAISADAVVAKLDTDKVSVDIRAPVAGKVTQWHGQVGDTLKVGAPLMTVELGAGGTAPAAPAAASNGNGSSTPKPTGPILTPAGEPSSDESAQRAPRAQSGAQAPTASNPTDPADDHRRHPSIAFRYGKRDASGSVGGGAARTHQHQGNQPVSVVGVDFLSANEAAAKAWDELPARYKKKGLKAALLDVIELGGAENYEPKKKRAA